MEIDIRFIGSAILLSFVVTATSAFAAPDGEWKIRVNTTNKWYIGLIIKDNKVTVPAEYTITPENVVVEQISDERLVVELTFSKKSSCKSGSTIKMDILIKNGILTSGTFRGRCLGIANNISGRLTPQEL
jgi:hypothetical protein